MADAGASSATCGFYPKSDDRALAVEAIFWLGIPILEATRDGDAFAKTLCGFPRTSKKPL